MSSLPDGFQPATIQTSNNIFRDNVITNNFNDASSKFLGYINQAYWATWLNLQALVIALVFWPCLHLFVPKDSIMDYNEMVFFHSLVCLIGASYLLYDTHKNLRLASSHLDVMIGTMTETNKIADTWVNLWRKMQDTNVEKASNIDNEEAEKHVNKNNEGKTILVVTHEHDIAMMCKRVVNLKDGVIVEDKKVKQNIIKNV